MKKVIVISFCFFVFSQAAYAQQQYHISVLQVANVQVYQNGYDGFMEKLKEHGIIEGANLVVKRHIIDADLDAGIWQKVGILFKIKKTAGKIIEEDPDLVLTIGTPATKYAKNKIIKAGIPLVFVGVASPIAAGCESMTHAGKGCTGTTIYIDATDVLKIIRVALPDIETIGIVHSDDDNGIAFAADTKEKASKMGISILTRQVEKSDKIGPAAMELVDEGVDMFGIPPDAYYALRDNEPSKDIAEISIKTKIPPVAFMSCGAPGAVLYIGPSMRVSGRLSADQAVKILKDGVKPEQIPVGMQKDLTILCDQEALKSIGLTIPLEILQLAKPYSDSY